jgi:tRNA(Ile)-lysidine synthase
VLVEQPPILQRRLVLEGLAQWLPAVERSARVAEEVAQLITSEVGQHVEFGAGRVWRTRKGLRFLPPSSSMGAVAPTALFAGRPLALPQGTLTLDLLDSTPDDLTTGGETVAYVDAERLSLPLTVRFWQPGDRLQPLGMTGTKRVSDLLTEAEVPPFTRPEVLVVTSDEAIVWVVGVRLSDRFKVRPSTRHVARIAFESSGNALPSG